MRRRHGIQSVTAPALALALAGAIAAQDAPPFSFGEFIDVQLVNVEVWVTDGKGNPVKGLTAADFEVLEDGEPVNITHFAELDGEQQVLSSVERMLATTDPEESAPPPPPPAVDPSHLVIYFDQLHLKPAGRKRLIEDLHEFFTTEQVPPERILILNQNFGLTTETTFGSTWEEIDAALERISKSAPLGGRVEAEKRLVVRRLQDEWRRAQEFAGSGRGGAADPCDFFLGRAVNEVELFASESRDRISITMDHLASAASFLTGVPGVKTMLYLSDSLERSPGTDMLSFINGLCPAAQQPPFIVADELSRAFRNLTRHANANRVTIYAIQAHGLEGSFTGSAAMEAFEQQGTRGLDTAVRFNERDGLSNLAAETGGRAIFNRNDFDAELTNIAREMVSYYSLAYEPPHGGDQREHEIEVRVRGKKLHVRHRRGYRDKNPDIRMTERLQGAVYLGLVDNSMGVRLGAGTVRVEEKGRVTVPIHILVPAENVAFLPQGDALFAHLSVQVSTRNTKNQKGVFEQSLFRLRRSPTDDGELVGVVMELTLPEGVHLVAVGVRDDATHETSFVTTTLELWTEAPQQTG